MNTLDERLEAEFENLKVSKGRQDAVRYYLGLLRDKHLPTYDHSVRVGLLCANICSTQGLNPERLFFAGALHDIGKLKINDHLLQKAQFTKKDMEEMKKHVEHSYEILKPLYPVTAEIALRHHRYQENKYPAVLPKLHVPNHTKKEITIYSTLLALADFYDAITTRNNDKFGTNRIICGDEAKQIMLDKHPDEKTIIEKLYDKKVFI